MKFKKVILSLILLSIIGCERKENKKENIPDSKTETVRSVKIEGDIIEWADAINNDKTNTIKMMYDFNAVKIIPSDSIIKSSEKIANYYENNNIKITSIESLFNVEAHKDRGINYEFVKYKTENFREYIQLVIWRLENENIIRELEFIKESTLESTEVDTTIIAEKRKLWIELCNANNSENLVKQLYSDNAVYFNHKPIVIGKSDLIKEYKYMNNKNYSLNLIPLKLVVVNSEFIFEIGQCTGSYNGKYIIVWNKQSDGDWKISFDSNI